MRIIETMDDIAEGVAHLTAVEPRFAHAVELAGLPPLRRREPGFGPLLQIVVGQQVSVAAADGIWRRVVEGGANMQDRVREMSEDDLRALGLSRPKARYARAIADALADGTLDLEFCATGPVDEAMKALTAVKGIGTWTAEIYLMFCVGRADIFADKDLALQESARLLFDLPERPDPKALSAMAENWSPWRGVAARALWSYYHVAKGREGVSAS